MTPPASPPFPAPPRTSAHLRTYRSASASGGGAPLSATSVELLPYSKSLVKTRPLISTKFMKGLAARLAELKNKKDADNCLREFVGTLKAEHQFSIPDGNKQKTTAAVFSDLIKFLNEAKTEGEDIPGSAAALALLKGGGGGEEDEEEEEYQEFTLKNLRELEDKVRSLQQEKVDTDVVLRNAIEKHKRILKVKRHKFSEVQKRMRNKCAAVDNELDRLFARLEELYAENTRNQRDSSPPRAGGKRKVRFITFFSRPSSFSR
jgi:hypothetical protein